MKSRITKVIPIRHRLTRSLILGLSISMAYQTSQASSGWISDPIRCSPNTPTIGCTTRTPAPPKTTCDLNGNPTQTDCLKRDGLIVCGKILESSPRDPVYKRHGTEATYKAFTFNRGDGRGDVCEAILVGLLHLDISKSGRMHYPPYDHRTYEVIQRFSPILLPGTSIPSGSLRLNYLKRVQEDLSTKDQDNRDEKRRIVEEWYNQAGDLEAGYRESYAHREWTEASAAAGTTHHRCEGFHWVLGKRNRTSPWAPVGTHSPPYDETNGRNCGR